MSSMYSSQRPPIYPKTTRSQPSTASKSSNSEPVPKKPRREVRFMTPEVSNSDASSAAAAAAAAAMAASVGIHTTPPQTEASSSSASSSVADNDVPQKVYSTLMDDKKYTYSYDYSYYSDDRKIKSHIRFFKYLKYSESKASEDGITENIYRTFYTTLHNFLLSRYDTYAPIDHTDARKVEASAARAHADARKVAASAARDHAKYNAELNDIVSEKLLQISKKLSEQSDQTETISTEAISSFFKSVFDSSKSVDRNNLKKTLDIINILSSQYPSLLNKLFQTNSEEPVTLLNSETEESLFNDFGDQIYEKIQTETATVEEIISFVDTDLVPQARKACGLPEPESDGLKSLMRLAINLSGVSSEEKCTALVRAIIDTVIKSEDLEDYIMGGFIRRISPQDTDMAKSVINEINKETRKDGYQYTEEVGKLIIENTHHCHPGLEAFLEATLMSGYIEDVPAAAVSESESSSSI